MINKIDEKKITEEQSEILKKFMTRLVEHGFIINTEVYKDNAFVKLSHESNMISFNIHNGAVFKSHGLFMIFNQADYLSSLSGVPYAEGNILGVTQEKLEDFLNNLLYAAKSFEDYGKYYI